MILSHTLQCLNKSQGQLRGPNPLKNVEVTQQFIA